MQIYCVGIEIYFECVNRMVYIVSVGTAGWKIKQREMEVGYCWQK
jgi:hypothetical protein